MVTTTERTHRLPTIPGTPSPTEEGKMTTMAKAEDQRPVKTNADRKIRHVRVENDLWLSACEKAESEGVTISEVVRRLLADYVA